MFECGLASFLESALNELASGTSFEWKLVDEDVEYAAPLVPKIQPSSSSLSIALVSLCSVFASSPFCKQNRFRSVYIIFLVLSSFKLTLD